jgi:hypothetical protein
LFSLGTFVDGWKAVTQALSFRRDNGPIDSPAGVEHFVATRAAFVAQKSLYGYLKARIGTRYPRVFDDQTFVRSINIAKYQVFAACLSDLAIYASAHALKDLPHGGGPQRALALRCFQHGLRDNGSGMPPEFDSAEVTETFIARLQRTDWHADALSRSNFTESPKALIRWAPIADHLKDDDREIIRNSITFAWRDIRERFQQRLDRDAVMGARERQLVDERDVPSH